MTKFPSSHYRETQFGFDWGAAKVTRLFSHNSVISIGVETQRQRVNLYITPTGKIRLFDGKNHEYKLSK